MSIILYGHGGSRNHGCEAIIRSTVGMLHDKVDTYTTDIDGDKLYGMDDITNLYLMHSTLESHFIHYYAAFARRIFNDYNPLIRYEYKDLSKMSNNVMVSVGGDNYCNGHPYRYVAANKLLCKRNKTVLWGCSISPELLKDQKIVEDLNLYSLIVARESLTYDAIIKAGVTSDVELLPDPAFTLNIQEIDLPEGFEKGNTVGINLSPLVESESGDKNPAMEGIDNVINYILSNTNHKIALIPHVVWEKSDDLKSLFPLYEKYKNSGRVILIDKEKKFNCMQLKYIISNCCMMVVARTHASIAAYSTCVPTLVLGYSIKSKGIAKDIFGTDKNYVVPVQNIKDNSEILNAFEWIVKNQNDIKKHLENIMPSYIAKSGSAGRLLLNLDGDQ